MVILISDAENCYYVCMFRWRVFLRQYVGESENDVLYTLRTPKITTKILKGKLAYTAAVKKTIRNPQVENLGTLKTKVKYQG